MYPVFAGDHNPGGRFHSISVLQLAAFSSNINIMTLRRPGWQMQTACGPTPEETIFLKPGNVNGEQ